MELSSPWFLFNDFVVKNISEQEALSFQDKWKVRPPIPEVLARTHLMFLGSRYYLP